MKLTPFKQYRVQWIDAFGESSWTDSEELEALITYFEKPIDQTLYFIKQSEHFYLFTSVKPEGKRPHGDIHGIPKKWITSIKPIK